MECIRNRKINRKALEVGDPNLLFLVRDRQKSLQKKDIKELNNLTNKVDLIALKRENRLFKCPLNIYKIRPKL